MWMNEWFHLGQQHQMAHPAEHCTEPGRALLGYFQGVLTGSLCRSEAAWVRATAQGSSKQGQGQPDMSPDSLLN